MKEIIIWFVIWFFVWGILNIYFKWKWEALKSKKYVPRGLFFLFSFAVTYYVFYQRLFIFSGQLLFSLVLTNFVGIILSINKKYYSKFFKDRFFILFQSFNILFQQSSILVLMLLLKEFLGNTYNDIYFGMIFFVIHTPLLLLKWVKLKYYLLMSCFIGGWLFSYFNFSYQYGLIISFLIHYLVYVWEMYYLKDEAKI